MFTIFLRSLVLSRLVICKTIQMYEFITSNYSSFHLWWKKNLLNYQKVSKYYEHDCLQNFILLFMSLLTALIVKNSHILAWSWLFQKKCHRSNLKGFQYQIWKSVKRSGKWLSRKTNFSAFLWISCSNFRLKLCQRPQIYENCKTK